MRIAISGQSGLIGTELSSALEKRGHQVTPMVRHKNQEGIYWNYQKKEIDRTKLESIDGIIHLAGQSIAGKRWTEDYKKKIYESRIEGTGFLAKEVSQLANKPRFFISASAIGYYGSRGNEVLEESSSAGEGFLAKVCIDWEKAAAPLATDLRLCVARIGIVLSSKGGALQSMLPPFKMGVGGPLGSGDQYMPWIDIDDIVQAFAFLVENEELSGVFNFTAPEPQTNSEFSKILAKSLNRPCFFKVPKFALKIAAGEMADELLLSSYRVVPKKLLDSGFQFKRPHLKESLAEQLA